GDAPICHAILDASFSGLLRRRVRQREQRLMVGQRVADWAGCVPEGFRSAVRGDLEALTDLAARLHVEDQMGPPLSRSGRAAVRSRMLESLANDATWVVQRQGEVVAKVDVSLYSQTRGAQIAGVYVLPRSRGRGIGGDAVAALSQQLLGRGLPGVTLHVRSDNAAAVAAYRRAGFIDHGPWILALR
ncbi:MAG TPA: GNAT family N-acetyltransferase, partial [Egibacteraceae bacterium]|nr:GNAT family N-acetyltransferase [Egibacteraceae bacterium]